MLYNKGVDQKIVTLTQEECIMKKTDIDTALWERLKQEMQNAIIEKAKTRSMVTYSELVNKLTSLQLDTKQAHHRDILAKMLGEISIAEDKAGRGMLSALVIHKAGDMEPGQGFFECAKSLNKSIPDKTKFWIQQVKKVHKYWTKS